MITCPLDRMTDNLSHYSNIMTWSVLYNILYQITKETLHCYSERKIDLVSKAYEKLVLVFVLRFHGPVKPMGTCRMRSVYLTTLLLGRLSPLSG